MPSFEIKRPAAGEEVPLIVHLPFVSDRVPPWVRATLAVDDTALREELRLGTDRAFADVFAPCLESGATLLVGGTSRLVCDPLRCLAAARGTVADADPSSLPERTAESGAVPLRSTNGRVLRRPDFQSAARNEVLREFGWPHADALAQLVTEQLAAHDACWVLTVRGYPSRPPGAAGGSPPPQVCLSHDRDHIPEGWVGIWRHLAVNLKLTVAVDTPIPATPLPGTVYRRDPRVRAFTVALRHDLILDEARETPIESHFLVMREFAREACERCKTSIVESQRR